MGEKGYKKLEVWKKSHELVIRIYRLTENFPKREEYGLTSQLKRAVLSIATNIVEGQASTSKKEFLSFLNIANRSLVETEYLIEVAYELKYIEEKEYKILDKLRNDIGCMLNGLMRSIRAKL
ncbi:MAG TPA: four helix bundle protein [Candidatus Omnitrophota bacterium]|nr:four helix bundle protein [Candidatus Omnitrophota bacterium]